MPVEFSVPVVAGIETYLSCPMQWTATQWTGNSNVYEEWGMETRHKICNLQR